MSSKYISVADTAKLVRVALKEAFPKIKFSVKSKSYSGGASINIHWTDGPTEHDVEAVAKQFEGASFDGMIDLKSYHTSELNGERVHFGADYIFCNRHYTREFLQRRAERVAEKYNVERLEVITDKWGYPELIGGHEPWSIGGRETIREKVMREAHKTRVA